MNNLVFGILTVCFCAIGYYFSWRYWQKDNLKIAVLLLIVCGLALRIFASADFFLHSWDERYHALVAKNLIRHPMKPTLYENPVLPYDYRNWSGNHIWLHKPPLPLWTMALSMWVFGINEIALRIPSIILTTIGILLSFKIGSYFLNKNVGYLAAFFYSINGLIIELTAGRTTTDHIDVFFLFFIELAVFFSVLFAQKKKIIYNIFTGISMGFAVLSKWLPALIVIPIWFLIIYDTCNLKIKSIVFHFIILLTTCIVIFLPWQIYALKNFPLEASWELRYNFKHITEVLENQTGSFLYFINKIRICYGELIYLPLVWFLWKTFKNIKNKKRLAISIWFLVPLIFFSCVKTKMKAYILFTSPALFIMTGEFFTAILKAKMIHRPKWLFSLILILLVVLPIRYSIERIKPFDRRDRNPQWVIDLRKLNGNINTNCVLFNYDRPIEAMFYTNLTAYKFMPNEKVIVSLIEKGYCVIINDNENISDDIKEIKDLVIVKLSASPSG